MKSRDPDELYESYMFYFLRGKYKQAYRSLEKLIRKFPEDQSLLEVMVELCAEHWDNADLAEQWVIKLARARGTWYDHLILARYEVVYNNFDKAREYLDIAKDLPKKLRGIKINRTPRKAIKEISDLIDDQEAALNYKKAVEKAEKTAKMIESVLKKEESPIVDNVKEKKKDEVPVFEYDIPVRTELINGDVLEEFNKNNISSLSEAFFMVDYKYLAIQGEYEDLLCLNTVNGIEKLWFQIETVKKVLKRFRGRVLLCDEVGLGKTIEAGIAIKEYLMRGMAQRIIILTPAPLVSQWKEEMHIKFGIDFISTDGPEFSANPEDFWKNNFVIASINTAKNKKNMPIVTKDFYDLIVVDEAHHLRNRATLSWKLVNQMKKKFIFLLTATPVQNNLIELFNLITLLKPGQFNTEKQFKKEYVRKGNLKMTADKDKLRELLSEVMIRNTRSAIDLRLPNRFATTLRLEPSRNERELYACVFKFLKEHNFGSMTIILLLREAGSSPFALKNTLVKIFEKPLKAADKDYLDGLNNLINNIDMLDSFCKGKAILDIISKKPKEKVIIFTQFIKSMEYIANLLDNNGIKNVRFSGNMTLKEKDSSIEQFKNNIPVLISTESGGEGRNLQFCNTIINFDLPWNPMKIEQRIGRIHRIGQTRDVFIFNLSIRGTIEDYIIDILDNKINMFEMVIGEIEPILGYLDEEIEFDNIILDIWKKSLDKDTMGNNFYELGRKLLNAKQQYLKSKSLDDEIFGDDYEI